jgi:hypothetical protein
MTLIRRLRRLTRTKAIFIDAMPNAIVEPIHANDVWASNRRWRNLSL